MQRFTRTLFNLTTLLMPFTLFAQPAMKPGDYYLEGVQEVGSGFRFNADKTFEFFFSYGAVDRIGKGTWEQKGNQIVLNSPHKPEKDFVLVTTKKTAGGNIRIVVKDRNEQILSYISCELVTVSGDTLTAESDQEGVITVASTNIKRISLIHRLWPDRFSVFEVSNPTDNYFEFTINPRIVDVEFNNLTLTLDKKDLRGGHPFVDRPGLRYVRSGE